MRLREKKRERVAFSKIISNFAPPSQTYISSSDKAFTAATIEAIGRVACSISEVTETCLHGLMSLLSHKDGKGSSLWCGCARESMFVCVWSSSSKRIAHNFQV